MEVSGSKFIQDLHVDDLELKRWLINLPEWIWRDSMDGMTIISLEEHMFLYS